MSHRSFKTGAVLAAGALVATVLSAASAGAATPFSYDYVKDGTYVPSCSGYHVTSSTGTTGPAQQDIVANAATKSLIWSGTNTLQDGTTPTPNTATQSWSMNATTRTTTNGALPKSISITWSASFSVTAPASASCFGNPDVYLQHKFSFTTTQPLIVTMAYHKDAHGYAETYIENSNNTNTYEDLYGRQLSGGLTDTFYLPAGTYDGYVEGDLDQDGFTTGRVSSSGSASISFAAPGSAVAGPSGAAAPYVSMGKNITCSTASLRTAITSNLTRKNQISKIVYAVNGRAVKTLYARAIRRGMVVNLAHLPARSAVTAKITVSLKNGKRLTESASYRPCII